MTSKKSFLLVLAWLGTAVLSLADTAPADFIRGALNAVPVEQKLAVDVVIRSEIRSILGARYPKSTVSYWQADGKTVWILQARGKVDLIDAGFVVENDRIVSSEVLVFRETRGKQIDSKRFLKQFKGVFLKDSGKLSRKIDGYSGATLSVTAMRKMAKMALYLDSLLPEESK